MRGKVLFQEKKVLGHKKQDLSEKKVDNKNRKKKDFFPPIVITYLNIF